ncbi:hypothetical protein [Saccharothrix hoggarensis]|uniref:Uncharacterized protein n=1 Tax=Saccharothrix hoggarensis TaxID=913853 RepID=A0ABW3QPY7_9PSEU
MRSTPVPARARGATAHRLTGRSGSHEVALTAAGGSPGPTAGAWSVAEFELAARTGTTPVASEQW